MTGNHICLSGRFAAADNRAGGSDVYKRQGIGHILVTLLSGGSAAGFAYNSKIREVSPDLL